MRDFLLSGYGEPEYQEDHLRKMYLAYRRRGFSHQEALKKAGAKASTDLLDFFMVSPDQREKTVS